MATARYIDTVPAPDPDQIRDKKVIILSWGRSGTMGLCKALEILGHKTYNMPAVMQNGLPHIKMFREALATKQTGEGIPYDRADFDKWLWDYDALSIVPSVLPEEIIQAYPDAKFILTKREPAAWAKSYWNTIALVNHKVQSFPGNVLKYLDPRFLNFSRLVDDLFNKSTKGKGYNEEGRQNAMKCYASYNEGIPSLIPKDQLLVVKVEDGLGWEQICPFLGVEVPNVPYPRINDTKSFQKGTSVQLDKSKRKFSYLLGTMAVAVAVGTWYILG
ncbi:P-loop containing nucleoside triphosphate hydrolase protein [Xylariaceae sp. FL0255]|nr:P-loop containing nucleoside triphosphate hydrolase protein [Xylariaceae sp. FL0255]